MSQKARLLEAIQTQFEESEIRETDKGYKLHKQELNPVNLYALTYLMQKRELALKDVRVKRSGTGVTVLFSL